MNAMDIVKEWYRYAESDLKVARHLAFTLHPRPLEIICYHAQQSAEKMLKGFLIYKGSEPLRTHDLQLLCNRCIELDASFVHILDFCELLTTYGVQPRYPYEIDLTEADCDKAIVFAGQLQTFINEHTALS